MCQIIEYNSEKTIIQTIAMFNLSIQGIQVRFSHQATMNGKIRRVIFLINQSCNFFDSIFSHLAFDERSQNTKSVKSITVIMIILSPLKEKYSSIQETEIHHKIQKNAHCVWFIVIFLNL